MNQARAERAAQISLGLTCLAVAVKLTGALWSGSISVLAEGLQSTLDILMSGMALWGLKVAARPPDRDHPFGHAKAELLVSLLQLALALAVAIVIMAAALPKVWSPPEILPLPGLIAMAAALLINLVSITAVTSAAKATGSAALKGEAAHLWSDTLASAGVLAGLGAVAVFRLPILDPLVAVFFTGLGTVFLLRRFQKVIHPLMDGSLPEDDVLKVRKALEQHPQVRGYHQIQTRFTGRERRVLLHVLLDDQLTFVEAHELAEEIEDDLSEALGGAVVTIHYEPFEAERRHRKESHPDGPPLEGIKSSSEG